MAKTQHDLRVSSSDDPALRSRDLPASYASNVRVVAYGLLHDFDSSRRATLCGIPLAELHRWGVPVGRAQHHTAVLLGVWGRRPV